MCTRPPSAPVIRARCSHVHASAIRARHSRAVFTCARVRHQRPSFARGVHMCMRLSPFKYIEYIIVFDCISFVSLFV